MILLAKRDYTNIYVSLSKEEDGFIDNHRLERIKVDKRHYTKNEIVKELIRTGIDVESGKYLKLDQSIDEFVSKLQNLVIETKDGERVYIRKSKEQVYNMIIEKGLQHLND